MTHRKLRKKAFSKTLAVIIISSLMFTNLFQESALDNNLTVVSEHDISSLERTDNYIDNDSLKNKPISFAYTPIDQLGGIGDNLTVTDELTVSHQVSLSLNSSNGLSNSFNIAGISGFTDDYLEYDLSISAERDDYIIFESAVDNKDATLESGQVRVAQGFSIPWDYGVFYGAEIYLDTTGPTLGNDTLELFIVKADGTGQPNMSDVRAFDLNGPYNSSNLIPASSTGNYAYYDFINISLSGDAILERGNYFVVANLSVVDDTDDEFFWEGQSFVFEDFPNYVHNEISWNLIGETRDLIVDLKPSYSNGTAIIFTDPTSIDFQDNALAITSLNQQITTTGLHTLSSNTSVAISMNNSYLFSNILPGTTVYTADNSTFPNYDISWDVIWNIPQVDLTSYSNPVRKHYIYTPSDWSNSVFSILINDSIPVSSLRNPSGYECSIQTLLSGSKYFEGDFKLQTSSPNYVLNTQISDDFQITKEFTLGYWTTDTLDAYGHEGSTVYVEVGINEIIQSGGILNFTLFNSTGEIIAWKNSSLLPSNIIYTDNSYYSGLGYFDPGDNVFKHNITIDPSINESDREGEWTAFILWQNGTEVGLFSSTIIIEKPTLAEFAWEEELGEGSMINDTLVELTRINGHGISVVVDYYNISDPFFSGIGTPIVNASVTYVASWGDSGYLVFDGSQYVLDIITDAPVGVYTVDLIASGSFLETQSIQFSVKIIHQFEISPVRTSYEVNYTNEVTVSFELRDISYGNELIEPDNVILTFNGSSLDASDYIYSFEDLRIKITIDTNDILDAILPIDSYILLITVTKTDFVADYGIDTAVDSTTIVVTPIPTQVQIEETVTESDINSQITLSFRFVDI
ncbi:MAG: hypothetical protein H7641_00895, partial [Candidatus Heimdallarchaeota archaeon]|nr:hypothetical protein [Candidatus Heimdallarchaeota archaeon]MCK4876123.1 hypothetical protein [Candidatus Heimdallarchaeota archaeon]